MRHHIRREELARFRITRRVGYAPPSAGLRDAATLIDATAWGIVVKKGSKDLAGFVGDIVKNGHAAGHIQELEKIWHIRPSVFAEEMRRRYANPQ